MLLACHSTRSPSHFPSSGDHLFSQERPKRVWDSPSAQIWGFEISTRERNEEMSRSSEPKKR